MNEPWSQLNDVLRGLAIATAEGDDAATQQYIAGLPYPGWPCTWDQWAAAVRKVAFSQRSPRRVVTEFLADVLLPYTVTIELTGLETGPTRFTSAHFTDDTEGDAFNNRLLRVGDRIFFTGSRVAAGEQAVATHSTYWDDPRHAGLTFPVTAEVLPFRLATPSPGVATATLPIDGAPLPVESDRRAVGPPCVVEVQLLGNFLELEPLWPYLYAGASIGDHDGTYLMDDDDLDPDGVGIYLPSGEVLEALHRVLQLGLLPSGVQLYIVWGTLTS